MTYVTHSLGGVAAGASLIQMAGILDHAAMACVAAGAIIGSLLPDIDHRKSKISNTNAATSVVAGVISVFFKHRGFLHTPVFAVILFAAMYVFAARFAYAIPAAPLLITAAVFFGALSHLILDSLTPGGIMWLWPVSKKRINFASIKTNSVAEKLFAGVFLALIGYVFIHQF